HRLSLGVARDDHRGARRRPRASGPSRPRARARGDARTGRGIGMSAVETRRERTFAWEDPERASHAAEGLGVLELMNAIIDGTLPPPPIARLLGMSVVAVGDGRAVFGLEPAEWMYNPIG